MSQNIFGNIFEQTRLQQKMAKDLATLQSDIHSIKVDVANMAASQASIDASLKAIVDIFAGKEIVGIDVQPGTPTQH